jgi:hypothetical protein
MEQTMNTNVELTVIQKLTRDLASASVTLGQSETRFLVDAYYIMQEQRKRSANQVLALSGSAEPHDVLRWFFDQNRILENQVKRALTKYAEGHPVGQRMLNVVGIGPVITAGLLAHIDIKQAPTVGHIWRFSGLDPTSKWEKGEKRPWNAALKTLCWKIGESFVKNKGRENCFYGQLYDQRKAYEVAINERCGYSDQAAAILKARPTHKQKAIYAEGKLPDGHIHARAKRYAVKLFLAHLHDVWYREEFGKAPPLPYAIAHLDHAHEIKPPF